MKAIITIFQCKRVVLPYIFIKYIYPKMKELFPGEMEVYLIQHIGNVAKDAMQSGKIPNSKLKLVQKWTDKGKYAGATIIQHSESFKNHPAIPSYKKGIEIAIKEKADFHIWLEDDALIFDEECNKWGEIIGKKDVGIYRPNDKYIHCAYLITTPNFDKRLLKIMEEKSIWNIHSEYIDSKNKWHPKKGHIEYFTTKCCKTGRAILNEKYAVRIHPGLDNKRVFEIIKKISPHEVNLLNIDFKNMNLANNAKRIHFSDFIQAHKLTQLINKKLNVIKLK